jgi:hypothetical protein
MLEQLAQPLGILDVGLAPGDVLDVLSVDQEQLEVVLQQVVDRLPIRPWPPSPRVWRRDPTASRAGRAARRSSLRTRHTTQSACLAGRVRVRRRSPAPCAHRARRSAHRRIPLLPPLRSAAIAAAQGEPSRSKILVGVLMATLRGSHGRPSHSARGLAVPERRRPRHGRLKESRPFHPSRVTTGGRHELCSDIGGYPAMPFVPGVDRTVVMNSPATPPTPAPRRGRSATARAASISVYVVNRSISPSTQTVTPA